jgi:DNA polymerase-3 subunit alpha
MGELTAERIVSEREENGKYISLQNFCERMKGRELNRRVVESLIKSGAFDGLGLNRRQMLENYEHIMSSVADSSRGVLEGQLNLLGNDCGTGMDMVIPPCQEYPMKQLLRMEKEAAGIYFSGNPISDYNILRSIMHLTGIGDIISLTEQGKLNDGDEVSFLCVLDEKRIYNTKKGGKMCFILCSDESGEIDAVVFTGLFEVCGSRLTEDSIFVINGKISVRDEKVSIICGSIFEESEFDRMTENMRLCIKTTSDSTELPQEFIKLCGEFPGNTEICFYLTNLRKTVRPRKKLSLKICGDSCLKLSKIFSDDKIGLIRIK